jgi:3-isopropylmalate dehydrogenase
MLLRHSLGLEEEAVLIEKAVDSVLDAGFRTKDIARDGESLSTTEMADKVLAALKP